MSVYRQLAGLHLMCLFDDLMVRTSAVIVGLLASVLGVLTLKMGLRAYEHTAGENGQSK